MTISMKVGLVVGVLMVACAAENAWASRSDARTERVLVTEFAGEGVAEFFLTPDLPRDWLLSPSRFHPAGDIMTVPVEGRVQVREGMGELELVDGEMFARGPALSLRVGDVKIALNHLRVDFKPDRAGLILYGSDELGVAWGRPVFVIDTTSVQASDNGALSIDAVVRLDGDFAAGMGAEAHANAIIGTLHIDMVHLDTGWSAVEQIWIDAPDAPGGGPIETGCPGGGPCGTSPDVFCLGVGDIFQKYGTLTVDPYGDGNPTPVTGYTMETWACNQGDEWASWIFGSADHPLISQNVFRIKDGRFEQIGMAWLKHTWDAADFGICPGDTHEPNATHLWMTIGLFDIYSAGLNAVQVDLGPRSDVNAASGVYPYPYTIHWDQSGNSIFKRLQIRNDDLDPSLNVGAHYLAEGYYLTTDEVPAGFNKQYNNALFRKVDVGTFTGGGYNLTPIGPQNTHQTAVEGWVQLANDPAETDHFDPDDWKPTLRSLFSTEDNAPLGKIQLAFNVTDLGGGMWAYDYHVYNYNSHRSVRSVSIPLPTDSASVNMAFHAPFYHSDEPVDNVAWSTANTPGGTAEWSTDIWTIANDKSANAVRWSTGYSFHLETSSPPDNAPISLGLFRPGPGADSLETLVLGPGPDCNGNNVADGVDISSGGFADDVPPGGDGIPDVCQAAALFPDLVATGATTLEYSIGGASSGDISVSIVGIGAENGCVDAFVWPDGFINGTPMSVPLSTWQAASPIVVSGPEIIPDRAYEFTILVDFVPDPTTAVQATTLVWGDVDNDGTVTLGDALGAVLDFQNGTVSALTDIEPCGGNSVVNMSDIQRIVLIFTGVLGPYPYGVQCTLPCP